MYDTVREGAGLLFVIGMVGRDSDGATVPGGIGAQTRAALERIEEALADVGRSREDIVRLRFYVVDMRRWPESREEVREFFGEPIPPATAVGVTGLVEPDLLIEIDAEATAE
jgi:enamine deaminase RidA (YjgF/YER057c/UK114 family)